MNPDELVFVGGLVSTYVSGLCKAQMNPEIWLSFILAVDWHWKMIEAEKETSYGFFFNTSLYQNSQILNLCSNVLVEYKSK